MSDCMTQEDAMNMSNEQAIQILKPFRDMMIDQHGCPISDAVFAIDKAIEALSAERKTGRWIPVSERLPEDGQRILVQMINGYIDVLNFSAVGITDHLVAWMPLPSPYTEESCESD